MIFQLNKFSFSSSAGSAGNAEFPTEIQKSEDPDPSCDKQLPFVEIRLVIVEITDGYRRQSDRFVIN